MRVSITVDVLLQILALLSLLAISAVAETEKNNGNKTKVTGIRLPTTVRPSWYKIQVIPYPDPEANFTLDGEVTIRVQVEEPVSKIILHAKEMKIDEPLVRVWTLADEQEENQTVSKIDYDSSRDFLILHMAEPLEPCLDYHVFIPYSTQLNVNLVGFYRSSYKDKKSNVTKWIAATQFSPTDARRAFPCFDEPSFKAEFEISIARKENMLSLSNMNRKMTEAADVKSETLKIGKGWVWDHYEKTVPMSTYIVAFIVCDFVSRPSDSSLTHVNFTLWARPDAIDQVEYARDIGPKILTFFEQYFNISFPLPKQDMIALPDLNPSAMENWGLITYRENSLLYDPRGSTIVDLKAILTTMSHEIAHQWFGNLVTPSWWSELWLKEGFASYMEIIVAQEVAPELKMEEQCVIDDQQYVFGLDALDSSHPMNLHVDNLDDVSEIFDGVSYSKGPSIIRMMHHFLSDQTFRLGLSHYLKTWAYKATTQKNVWDSLTQQAWIDGTIKEPLTVRDIMDTWTLQKGYPCIYVTRDYDEQRANFTQRKFTFNKNISSVSEDDEQTWWVPITYASPQENSDFARTNPHFWLNKSQVTREEDLRADPEDWVIVNSQETGYYRVNYDLRNWKFIIDQLSRNYSAIHAINRAQILDDMWNLAKSSDISYSLAFSATKYLTNETEYVPWKAFLTAFTYVSGMLEKTAAFGPVRIFAKELLTPQYHRIGLRARANESALTTFLRVQIVFWSCDYGVEACIADSQRLFSVWMQSSDPDTTNPIPTSQKRTVYCTAIKHGGEKEWNFLWKRYLTANLASERVTILRCLACSKEIWILNKLLEGSLDRSSGIRKQDSETAISMVAQSDIGSILAFRFMQSRWQDIKSSFPGLFALNRIMTAITTLLCTPLELDQLQEFKRRNSNQLGAATRAIDQAIERVGNNVKWHEAHYQTIFSWLRENTENIN